MTNELLIVKACFRTGLHERAMIHADICKQLKNSNVVVLPFGWDVLSKPSDVDIRVESEKYGETTRWEYIDNPSYSSLDPGSKEYYLFCDECGITIPQWDRSFYFCPHCGKSHSFNKEK